ncbi:hypothetical protein CK203_046026 [Vitis vinifera]|uniref:Uncharacterized protein n=1 Tax=Vitis vinifera TaxID=29760 RepID=A0A438HGU8_VITVI|nr:hypothetical protein CK203_046026 [Vitis vinifera]
MLFNITYGKFRLEGGYRRLQLEQLNQQEAENLEHPFSEEEIHSALMEMNGDKAPGPMAFWQRCWAYRGGRGSWGIQANQSLGGLYKLLAKILDASLIANEVIDAGKKGKREVSFCISTAKFSVLVNGVSAGFFPSSKGLRHPLSLPLCDGNGGVEQSIRRAVEGAASGLRINLEKSEIIPVGGWKRWRRWQRNWAARKKIGVGRIWLLLWGMVSESVFGMIFGAGVQCCPKGLPHLYGMAAHRNGNLLHTLRGFIPTLEEDAVFLERGKKRKV